VVLAVSLELSEGSWKLALHDGRREKPTIHTVSGEQAGDRLVQAMAARYVGLTLHQPNIQRDKFMRYRRANIPGATYFFTVNLADRTKSSAR
jgi:hypothetical protein